MNSDMCMSYHEVEAREEAEQARRDQQDTMEMLYVSYRKSGLGIIQSVLKCVDTLILFGWNEDDSRELVNEMMDPKRPSKYKGYLPA